MILSCFSGYRAILPCGKLAMNSEFSRPSHATAPVFNTRARPLSSTISHRYTAETCSGEKASSTAPTAHESKTLQPRAGEFPFWCSGHRQFPQKQRDPKRGALPKADVPRNREAGFPRASLRVQDRAQQQRWPEVQPDGGVGAVVVRRFPSSDPLAAVGRVPVPEPGPRPCRAGSEPSATGSATPRAVTAAGSLGSRGDDDESRETISKDRRRGQRQHQRHGVSASQPAFQATKRAGSRRSHGGETARGTTPGYSAGATGMRHQAGMLLVRLGSVVAGSCGWPGHEVEESVASAGDAHGQRPDEPRQGRSSSSVRFTRWVAELGRAAGATAFDEEHTASASQLRRRSRSELLRSDDTYGGGGR